MKQLSTFVLLAVFAGALTNPFYVISQESKENKPDGSALPLAVEIEVKPRLMGYLKVRQTQILELSSKYGKVIEDRLSKSASTGDLKTAQAFQGEKDNLNALGKVFTEELKDPVTAVKKGATLPELKASAPEALVSLRKIWTTELQKIRIKLDGELQQTLKKLETDWTKARDFKNAQEVLTFRESLLSSASVANTNSKEIPTTTSATMKESPATASATIEKPYENSLGMRFVPVPIMGGTSDGKRLLFSIWETRVKDYEAFIRKNRSRYWEDTDFKQKSDHPAVNVSWDDAVAFCSWLTVEEKKKGVIKNTQVYRLPTDHEWSCAVGIGADEDAGASPMSKASGRPGVYPWGNVFPPTKGAGNYYGEEMKKAPLGGGEPIPGYDDGFEVTSSVGSFNANAFGLYDMGGNVKEWCEDFMSPTDKDRRIARDAGWSLFLNKNHLESAFRNPNPPAFTHFSYGFRIVLTPPE